jgi:threonine/homoserine/homoserine lactone efflux protein
MISGGQLLGFTLASLVLIVIPGPGVLFVVGRALAHGRRTALATACGWGFAASAVRNWFARSPRRFELVGGAGGLAMIGVGVTVAVTGRQS